MKKTIFLIFIFSLVSCGKDKGLSDLIGDVVIATSENVLEVAVLDKTRIAPFDEESNPVELDTDGIATSEGEVNQVEETPAVEVITDPSELGYTPYSSIDSSVKTLNLTNLNEVVTVSLSYNAEDEPLNSCLVNDPFISLTCDVDSGINLTRNDISAVIGSNSTSSLKVEGEKDSYKNKMSNSLTARKSRIVQISDINDDSESVSELVVWGDSLYFSAINPDGYLKLMKYDGEKIIQISNIKENDDDYPSNLKVFNNELYFSAKNSTGSKLFRYDGTTIYQVSDINASGNDMPENLTVSTGGDIFFFTASPDGTNKNLFKYDGSVITKISNITGSNDDPSYLTFFNDNLYFSAYITAGSSKKLFEYNIIENKVYQISNINSSGTDHPEYLKIFNNELYFSAISSGSNSKLYRYNAEENKIYLVSNINDSESDGLECLTVFKNALYFYAVNSDNYSKLFKYNGTSIYQISNINENNDDAPYNLKVSADGNILYFGASKIDILNRKLFKYDGVYVYQISDIYEDGSDEVNYLTNFNEELYFVASDEDGEKIYKYEY